MKAFLTVVFSFFLLLFSSNNHAKKAFAVDRAHSSVGFSVTHLGIIPVKGSFSKFDADISLNDNSTKIEKLSAKIEVDSIDTKEEDRDAHLKGSDFFWCAK